MMGIRFRLRAVMGAMILAALAANLSAADRPELAEARKARDRADQAGLAGALEASRAEAARSNTLDAHLRHALLAHWMVEVSYAHNDPGLGKNAAEEGIAAAEKAVALDRNSSEAHSLLGQLYGEIIPFAMLGGIRFGPKSERELTKAIALDRNSVEAHIGQGINKMFTPSAFGGSLPEAIELLKRAIELDPASDTAHAWLAQAYESGQQHSEALKEIEKALRLNPERGWLKYVREEVSGGKKK